MTDKISTDMAESEFDRFVDLMDLDVDENDMDEEDLKAFRKIKRRIIKAIRNGSLVVNENGEPVYEPQKLQLENPLTFHEKDGAALMATDGKKKNHSISQMFSMLGAITKVHPNTFAKMKGNDLSICVGIFTLLMD